MRYLSILMATAMLTLTVGCGKNDMKGQPRAEAEAKQKLQEFNKTDINSYPAATATTTKEEAQKQIASLNKYKKLGTDVLKITRAKKLTLENGNTVESNIQTADALIESYKKQIGKLELEQQ